MLPPSCILSLTYTFGGSALSWPGIGEPSVDGAGLTGADCHVSLAPGMRARRHRSEPLTDDYLCRPPFTLEQIRTFLVVAAREHISQAARELCLSQPAVTQRIHLFERAIGDRLLERVGRNVQLTEAGLQVVDMCRPIMRSVEKLAQRPAGTRDDG